MSDEPQKNQDEEIEKEDNNTNPPEPEKTIEEVAEEYFNNWKRALADYDNLKKSIAREKVEMAQFAKGLAAYDFAAIYDNFKKAAAHLPEAGEDFEEYKKKVSQWALGIDFIKKQFAETLKQLGLEEIKITGEKFNPSWHEALGEEAVEGVEPGLVLKEIEGGYKMGDKVIKAAKVVISK